MRVADISLRIKFMGSKTSQDAAKKITHQQKVKWSEERIVLKHLVDRAVTSDWHVLSFTMVVYENFFSRALDRMLLPVTDPRFPKREGGANPWVWGKASLAIKIFVENHMKMKVFGPRGGSSLAPLLDPPMIPSGCYNRVLHIRNYPVTLRYSAVFHMSGFTGMHIISGISIFWCFWANTLCFTPILGNSMF